MRYVIKNKNDRKRQALAVEWIPTTPTIVGPPPTLLLRCGRPDRALQADRIWHPESKAWVVTVEALVWD
jgi:hypothetical protein